MKKLKCILLVDDNDADNNYHRIVIEEMEIVEHIEIAMNGFDALKYLRDGNHAPPELIFLDINMPAMNGWEFLEEYKELDESRKARMTIIMLTTSNNPEDRKRAERINEITAFTVKPLTDEALRKILTENFPENIKD
jgi:CheY-like chemotaxis protein